MLLRSFLKVGTRDAFNELDGEAVARLYAVPSGLVTGDGYAHWSEFESVRKNMTALCKLYRENGYVSASFDPAAFLAQGDGFAIAGFSIDTCGS